MSDLICSSNYIEIVRRSLIFILVVTHIVQFGDYAHVLTNIVVLVFWVSYIRLRSDAAISDVLICVPCRERSTFINWILFLWDLDIYTIWNIICLISWVTFRSLRMDQATIVEQLIRTVLQLSAPPQLRGRLLLWMLDFWWISFVEFNHVLDEIRVWF